MKTLRRLVFAIATLVIIVCAGLLITNFDPTNPTHRRYSSETVLSTGDAPSDDIGRDGERVLSKDLGVPRNDADIPVLVVCNTRFKDAPPPAKNTECFFYSDDIENYRVPDFLTDDYIAESKNAEKLLVTQDRDYKQIKAFAVASAGLNRPLYIYVRHNTKVDAEFYELFAGIDGGVIHYFMTKEHVDPIDFYLLLGIVASLSVIILWIVISNIVSFLMPFTPPQSSVAIKPHKTSRKAKQSVDEYDKFMRNAGDNARKTLDE